MDDLRYRAIVADPPWEYNAKKGLTTNGAKASTAEAHYPTLTMREIAALPVRELADDDSIMFLWVTNPRLFGDRGDHSFGPIDILEAWGFEYKTMLTWVKTGAPGMGWWFRGETEHVLVGARGKARIPTEKRERNYLIAPKRRHSQKPEAFYDLVERVAEPPYLEMFARRNRFLWDTWGNESLEHVVMPS